MHAYLCADQPLKPLQSLFFAALRIRKYGTLAIRRAVIFDVDFVINGGQESGLSLHDLYIGSMYTHIHIHAYL